MSFNANRFTFVPMKYIFIFVQKSFNEYIFTSVPLLILPNTFEQILERGTQRQLWDLGPHFHNEEVVRFKKLNRWHWTGALFCHILL